MIPWADLALPYTGGLGNMHGDPESLNTIPPFITLSLEEVRKGGEGKETGGKREALSSLIAFTVGNKQESKS